MNILIYDIINTSNIITRLRHEISKNEHFLRDVQEKLEMDLTVPVRYAIVLDEMLKNNIITREQYFEYIKLISEDERLVSLGITKSPFLIESVYPEITPDLCYQLWQRHGYDIMLLVTIDTENYDMFWYLLDNVLIVGYYAIGLITSHVSESNYLRFLELMYTKLRRCGETFALIDLFNHCNVYVIRFMLLLKKYTLKELFDFFLDFEIDEGETLNVYNSFLSVGLSPDYIRKKNPRYLNKWIVEDDI